MELLPSVNIEKFVSSDTLSLLERLIYEIGQPEEYIKDNILYSRTYDSNYNSQTSKSVQDIIDPLLNDLLPIKVTVQTCHLLESSFPYKIHTDTTSGDRAYKGKPAYTIILPLDTYDSYTIVFNEWLEDTNELEAYKAQLEKAPAFSIDKKFCAERLSHCHPKDLQYLSLKECQKWNKGSAFAMDRRYFHCSDNYHKHEHTNKRGIIIWTNYA